MVAQDAHYVAACLVNLHNEEASGNSNKCWAAISDEVLLIFDERTEVSNS